MTPDVNVLVAAARADHPHHRPAYDWLEETLVATGRGVQLTLLPMVTAGFLRVVTNTRIFPIPTPGSEATAFIRVLLEERGAVEGTLGSEWSLLAQLCEQHALSGGDLTDAWIAAAVRTQGEHLVTFDRGFRRFLRSGELTLLDAF